MKRAHVAVLPPHQAVVGGGPHGAVIRLHERPHARACGDGFIERDTKAAVAIDHGGARATDPEVALGVLHQSENRARAELRRRASVEHRETDAVEAREPVKRADPEIAISGLRHRLHGVLGEALFDLPAVVLKLGERAQWIERQQRRAGSRPHHEHHRQPTPQRMHHRPGEIIAKAQMTR
jgi:hypothetical protein